MKCFKKFVFALSILMVVFLSSCGGNKQPVDNPTSTSAPVSSSVLSDIDLTGSNSASSNTESTVTSSSRSEPAATDSNNEVLTEEEQSRQKQKLMDEINSLMEN